jgi:hypothetical protein
MALSADEIWKVGGCWDGSVAVIRVRECTLQQLISSLHKLVDFTDLLGTIKLSKGIYWKTPTPLLSSNLVPYPSPVSLRSQAACYTEGRQTRIEDRGAFIAGGGVVRVGAK